MYHGTPEENLDSIAKEGFTLSRIGTSTHNDGYYGKGIYFTADLLTANVYSRWSHKILKCRVLLGRSDKCQRNGGGWHLNFGYDSHTSAPTSKRDHPEFVIFHPEQINVESVCSITEQ